MDCIHVFISLVFVQSLKGRPPPAPLFGDDEDDDDLDWLNWDGTRIIQVKSDFSIFNSKTRHGVLYQLILPGGAVKMRREASAVELDGEVR